MAQLDHNRETLSHLETDFRQKADRMPRLAWIADGEGSIYWYNKRWYDYTGTSMDDMHGWGWQSVHHPDHVERVVKRLKSSFAAGTPWEDLFPLRGRDGTYRWFLSEAQPLRAHADRPRHDRSGRRSELGMPRPLGPTKTSRVIRSAISEASRPDTSPPKEKPAIARRLSRGNSRSSPSRTCAARARGSAGFGGRSDPPNPGRSGASSRNSSPSAGITRSQ